MLQWFYANQDPQTGFWGPKSRASGQLLKRDLTNTASIIKTFLDRNGNEINPLFPLRYKEEMFKTALEVMSEPKPSSKEDYDEWHEWSLKMGKGLTMLTRYLWKDASEEHKFKAKLLIENIIKTTFENLYVANEGAFSYYPNSRQATLDGTGTTINRFIDFGLFSAEKQNYLWGNSDERIVDLGVKTVSTLTDNHFEVIKNYSDINSLRFYETIPDFSNLTTEVYAVAYPQQTPVRDVMDFTPKVNHWLNTTSQSMGNWTSKEAIIQKMNQLELDEVPVYENGIPCEEINEFLQKNKQIVVLGFDVRQVPRYKIVFEVHIDNYFMANHLSFTPKDQQYRYLK